MARAQSRYVCQSCGAAVLRWEGQCRTCGDWNTLVETVVRDEPRRRLAPAAVLAAGSAPVPLSHAGDGDAEVRRPVGIGELDRVLGGGLVAGSVVLLGGEPGIGKSTLLLQVAAGRRRGRRGRALRHGRGVASAGPAARGASRARPAAPWATRSTSSPRPACGRIVELARAARPGLLVVDSVQTVASEELDGPPGSVGQVREATLRLMELAKAEGIPVVLVGHVTKDGTLAGPKTLEHLVDVVLSIEGDRTGGLRLLRAAKNRFGSTEEVGVFEMARPRPDRGRRPGPRVPRRARRPGARAASWRRCSRARRPLLVEVQALVAPSAAPSPRAHRVGLDPNRLALLVAVLGRRAGHRPRVHDVYANLAGGLSVERAGARPAARAGARVVAARPAARGGHGRDRRGRAARRAARRRRPRPPAARGGPARLHAGDRAPARVREIAMRLAGIELVVVGSLADAVRGWPSRTP